MRSTCAQASSRCSRSCASATSPLRSRSPAAPTPRPACCCLSARKGKPPLAWLGLIGPASRSAADPDGAALSQSLRPVLLLLAREVAASAQLRRQRFASLQAAEQTAELRWLLATSSHAGRSAGADRLEATLDACAAHLGCDGVLLWLADRQLERCVTRRSIPQAELETLRRLARG